MKKKEIKKIVKILLKMLVNGQFELIYENDYAKKLSIDDVKDEILAYPSKLTIPPDVFFENLDLYETNFENQIWIDIPLWFNYIESDLTLSCLIYEINNEYLFSIEDIHVL